MKKVLQLAVILALSLSVFCGVAFAAGVVDLNKATAAEIMAIEGANVPKDLAEAIVKHREKGPFKTGDDLLKVPGMSNEVWQRLNPVETPDGKVVHDPDADTALAPSKC